MFREGGKANSPTQILRFTLSICGAARPHRASDPPPKQSSGNVLPFIIVNLYVKQDFIDSIIVQGPQKFRVLITFYLIFGRAMGLLTCQSRSLCGVLTQGRIQKHIKQKIYLYINLACLSGCLFVFNKRKKN